MYADSFNYPSRETQQVIIKAQKIKKELQGPAGKSIRAQWLATYCELTVALNSDLLQGL